MNHTKESQAREDALISLLLADEAKSPQAAPSPEFLARLNARLDANAPARSMRTWYAAAAVLITLFAGFYVFRAMTFGPGVLPRIASIVGEVKLDGRVLANMPQLKVGSRLETSPTGYALVEIDQKVKLLVEPDTKLLLTRFTRSNKPIVEWQQETGRTFSAIVPGSTEYHILSGQTKFSAVGTAFTIASDSPGAARLIVHHGTVATGTAMYVQKGEQTNCTNAICKRAEPAPSSAQERVAALAQVSNQEQLRNLAGADQVRRWNIAELKEKYGKLSRIETSTGKKYVGGFRAHNGQLIIQTLTEKVQIDGNLVKRIIPAENAY